MSARDNLMPLGLAAAVVVALAILVLGTMIGWELWRCRGDGARTCRLCNSTGGALAALRPRVCYEP